MGLTRTKRGKKLLDMTRKSCLVREKSGRRGRDGKISGWISRLLVVW